MIRAPWGDEKYWNDGVLFYEKATQERTRLLADETPANPSYDAQFSLDLSKHFGRLVFCRYSRGDPIPDLAQHFPGLLDAWALSNRLSDEICAEHHLQTCRDWTFSWSNLNHYNWCFWLVGLALALDIPDDQWQRLLVLIDGEGEDILLDRIIATRSPTRKIGARLLHPKPYARLLAAIDAPADQQALKLREFVDHWYAELARKSRREELWWYIYGDPVKHPLEMGSYFGRWCIEAVAAAKAFGLDDRLCLGHEHYPGDLLRPNGPSTHPPRHDEDEKDNRGWLAKLLGKHPKH